MATYDQRARAQAIRQLAPVAKGGRGQAVTVTTPGTPGTHDPMTDTTSGGSPPASHETSGVETKYKADSIDGTVIQRGDVLFLLSPVKLDGADLPTPVADRDTLSTADGTWLVKHVETIRPTGLTVMHKLQLRKGG